MSGDEQKCPRCGGELFPFDEGMSCRSCAWFVRTKLRPQIRRPLTPTQKEKYSFIWISCLVSTLSEIPQSWLRRNGVIQAPWTVADWLLWLGFAAVMLPIQIVVLRAILFSNLLLVKRIFIVLTAAGYVIAPIALLVFPLSLRGAEWNVLTTIQKFIVVASYFLKFAVNGWFLWLLLRDYRELEGPKSLGVAAR